MESAEQMPALIQTGEGGSEVSLGLGCGGLGGGVGRGGGALPAIGGKKMAMKPRKMSLEHILR